MNLLTSSDPLACYARFAISVADAARRETARWRDLGGATDNKAGEGAYDPVTEADRAAEAAMRRVIEKKYPDHGIRGEEYPERPASGPFTWSLDPIDGTRSFVCGLPSWVTLIGLLDQDLPVMGVIDAPRLDERYIGYEDTALVIEQGHRRAINVSECRSLADARFSTTDAFLFDGAEQPCFERVRRAVRVTRYGHDGYAYARLAAGSIDLVIESGLKPYDYHALIPIVRAAGGVIGDWHGGSDFSSGRVVAAATLALYDEAIEMLDFDAE